MKKALLSLFCASVLSVQAQTDVTNKYIDNPDFAARFAGWENDGSFTFNTANTFEKRNGEVWMEKWVSQGSKLGTNNGMSQRLIGLAPGTYTLTSGAKNIQQSNKSATQKGAYIYGGDVQTDINEPDDYKVRFTVLTGQTRIGVKLASCTGNWVCIDNFRLDYEGFIADEADAAMQKLIDEAESIYKEEGNTAAELRTAIDNAKASIGQQTEASAGELATALQRATLEYRIQNATGTIPKVTTSTYVATGTTIALARATISGSNFLERGFCWSTEPEPTIHDNRSTRFFTNNGNIYVMDKLEPATIYYVRAYALTKTYQLTYGNVVKIATLPYGKVTCDYGRESDDEEVNARINSAILECIWLWNNLCHIENKNISVHYSYGAGAGDGTADCNINGWMRVSQNKPYQQTGTMFHETNHGMGVGTTDSWYNNPILRSATSRGDWLGPRATQMVRFFENNNTAVLTGDGTHMWPYGINGAHEDQYNPENTCLYYANALITHALHQDGLCYTWQGTPPVPAYVFQQDENKKYYIKCEDEACGLQTSYLTMDESGKLILEAASAEEVKGNDAYAWNITFDPVASLYIFHNAGHDKYLSYAGSTIKGVTKASATTSEKFQLMPSRKDVQMGKFNAPSFWIMKNGDKALKGNGTATQTAGWDATNEATSQRWLLLEAEDVDVVEAEAVGDLREAAKTVLNEIRAVIETPHTESIEGCTADFTALIESMESQVETMSAGELDKLINEAKDALKQYLHDVVASDPSQPFDITLYVSNPKFADGKNGWTETSGSGAINYGCIEYFNQTFDINQTLPEMPVGMYLMTVNGYQRPGALDAVYANYAKGDTATTSYIYINATSKNEKLPNICRDAQSTKKGGEEKSVGGKYVPNNMLAASKYFANDLYKCSFIRQVTASNKEYTNLKMGVKCTKNADSYWNIFTNVRLYYYGNVTEDYITGIKAPVAQQEKAWYDLSGRRIQQPTKRGIYIVDGKKILK